MRSGTLLGWVGGGACGLWPSQCNAAPPALTRCIVCRYSIAHAASVSTSSAAARSTPTAPPCSSAWKRPRSTAEDSVPWSHHSMTIALTGVTPGSSDSSDEMRRNLAWGVPGGGPSTSGLLAGSQLLSAPAARARGPAAGWAGELSGCGSPCLRHTALLCELASQLGSASGSESHWGQRHNTAQAHNIKEAFKRTFLLDQIREAAVDLHDVGVLWGEGAGRWLVPLSQEGAAGGATLVEWDAARQSWCRMGMRRRTTSANHRPAASKRPAPAAMTAPPSPSHHKPPDGRDEQKQRCDQRCVTRARRSAQQCRRPGTPAHASLTRLHAAHPQSTPERPTPRCTRPCYNLRPSLTAEASPYPARPLTACSVLCWCEIFTAAKCLCQYARCTAP